MIKRITDLVFPLILAIITIIIFRDDMDKKVQLMLEIPVEEDAGNENRPSIKPAEATGGIVYDKAGNEYRTIKLVIVFFCRKFEMHGLFPHIYLLL